MYKCKYEILAVANADHQNIKFSGYTVVYNHFETYSQYELELSSQSNINGEVRKQFRQRSILEVLQEEEENVNLHERGRIKKRKGKNVCVCERERLNILYHNIRKYITLVFLIQPTPIEVVYNFWILDGLQRRGFRPNTNMIQNLMHAGENTILYCITTKCTINRSIQGISLWKLPRCLVCIKMAGSAGSNGGTSKVTSDFTDS